MSYIKCKSCNLLIHCKNNSHIDNCYPNWNDASGLIFCYSCGLLYSGNEGMFSSKQLNKERYARCKQCIQNNKTDKYAKYIHNYKKLSSYDEYTIHKLSLNKQLEYYVEQCNYDKVMETLNAGADPNYVRQMTINNQGERGVFIYDENGLEVPENDAEIIQPKSPLRLCMFFLCNMLNQEADYQTIYCIAKALIVFGANNMDALQYYKSLYGNNYGQNDLWKKIYELLLPRAPATTT